LVIPTGFSLEESAVISGKKTSRFLGVKSPRNDKWRVLAKDVDGMKPFASKPKE